MFEPEKPFPRRVRQTFKNHPNVTEKALDLIERLLSIGKLARPRTVKTEKTDYRSLAVIRADRYRVFTVSW
jgi:hypothetical protein